MNFNIPKVNINIPKVVQSKDNKSRNFYNPAFKSQSQTKDTFELSVGYINDIHGQTNNMLRILSGFKGDLKLSAGDNDIGDEKNVGVHKATTKFLNMTKVRATALGNHELDTHQADCISSIKNFP